MSEKGLYKNALINAMTFLGEKSDTIFIGQQIVWYGNPMSSTLDGVPKNKLIEVPVFEESQMGMSLGLAMDKKFVITFYPRWDFLVCAMNQLVNHVDKLQDMSNNQWVPNIIIRVGKGGSYPLDPGHQHKANYFSEFKPFLKNATFYDLTKQEDIIPAYMDAYKNGGISLIAEYPELYNL